MFREDYTTAPSTPPTYTPGSSTSSTLNNNIGQRSPSITLSEALRSLGQGGATRSQILRGPVADGFDENKSCSTGRTDLGARLNSWFSRQKQQQPQSKRLVKPKNHHTAAAAAAVVQVEQTDEVLDRLVHTVDQTDAQQQTTSLSLPPLTKGVPSRGIFSKTRGHYVYKDTAHMLPVAKLPDRFSTTMSDISRDGKEERAEQVEGAGVLNENRATFADTGAGAAPLTFKKKAVRHYKKWWWAHLLAVIAIVVLVVCLIIFIAIPKIAQSRVNQATLTIQGITLSQTQATNFTLAINSTIEADDSIHAVIDPFEGVMYLEDWAPQTPFARINFPSVTSAAKSAVNITQFTQILDLNAFTVFNTWFIQNETIRVTVEGDSQLRVSGVNRKYPVHFKKTLEFPALSNFNGTTVPNSTILLTPNAQGDNFVGTAIIPNRSFINFEIGNATFINFMVDTNGTAQNVGNIFIDNLIVAPGNHSYALRGTASQTPVLQQVQERPYCTTGNIPFLLQGLNVTNHGQYLSYYADSLASTNQSVAIPIKTDLENLGLTINCSD